MSELEIRIVCLVGQYIQVAQRHARLQYKSATNTVWVYTKASHTSNKLGEFELGVAHTSAV